MDNFPLDLFRIGEIEFGISFVSNEDTLNNLRSVAGQHGLKIIFIGKTDDGAIVSALSSKEEDVKNVDINGFLRFVRKQERWFTDTVKLEGYRMLMFYNREVCS